MITVTGGGAPQLRSGQTYEDSSDCVIVACESRKEPLPAIHPLCYFWVKFVLAIASVQVWFCALQGV